MNWTQISLERSPGHSSFQPIEVRRNPQPTENDSFLSRMILPLLTLLTMLIGMDCKVIESVVFHTMDWIHSSICSWLLTTAIDFNPYKDAVFGINQYALKVKQSLTRYTESFQSSDLGYSLLLNMTMDDISIQFYAKLLWPKLRHLT